MSLLKTLPVFVCAILLVLPAQAGKRAPGKYRGVVVFDRWDGCILYSGIYVMYISERTKEKLREHTGKSIQIDAKKVSQPRNPGDGGGVHEDQGLASNLVAFDVGDTGGKLVMVERK